MSNIDRYNDIFIENFDVSADDLNDAFTYENVEGWDSIAHIALVGAMEDTFDIMLDTEDILVLNSYEAGKSLLEKYGVTWD